MPHSPEFALKLDSGKTDFLIMMIDPAIIEQDTIGNERWETVLKEIRKA